LIGALNAPFKVSKCTSDQVAISMDWLPTLLAAAGTAPDPGYPPDGMNLLPALTGNAAAVDRKLFWRYKGKWRRAARIGDYKFLKILDNTFLFNVVEDPLERGYLKERHKDIYEQIVAEWHAWNASMLPEIGESFTRSFGDVFPDPQRAPSARIPRIAAARVQ
jgi:arylsulfatase A-like enzyme